MEAHGSALSAYEAQASQAARLRELEKEILELKDWKGEAERYRLGEIGPGLLAFSLKPGMERGEPPHHLCANCYNKKQP